MADYLSVIDFQQVLPKAFADKNCVSSDIWHRQVSFERGKTYLIEAASGTGKSSLCSFVFGYRSDYEGIITFDGENIRRKTVAQWTRLRRTSLSMLFQELRLFPELTAWENVMIKNTLTGFRKKSTVRDWFDRLGIADKMKQRAGLLSYGQQQRVAFIRGLCQPFDFIFLDEPVSHLDEGNAAVMAGILSEEASAQGAGVIVTSIGNRLLLDYEKTFSL